MVGFQTHMLRKFNKKLILTNRHYPNLNRKTGQFMPIPKGKKSPKMIDMETQLKVKFEDDYKERYLSGEIGQKRFSSRWNVSNKSLIFGRNLRGGRRSWVEMLNLPRLNTQLLDSAKTIVKRDAICEVCEESNVSLDRAHWIENKDRGSAKSENILKLCPNCHRKLDRNDETIVETARGILLLREVQKLLNSKITREVTQKELVRLCRAIILSRSKNE